MISETASGEKDLAVDPHALYRDATAPIEERVADLISRMTLEEKAGQLFQTMVQIAKPVGVAAAARTAKGRTARPTTPR